MQFILEEESGTYILTGVLCFTINVASKRDNNQQAGMPPLRAGRTSLQKERKRKEIQYDIFSGFLSVLEEVRELPGIGFVSDVPGRFFCDWK